MSVFKDIGIPLLTQGLGNALNFGSELATQAVNYNYWKKQQDYNSPQNQMSRLESAGLNPNLVYGSSNVAGNTASNIPQMQNSMKFDALQAINQYQDLKIKTAQERNLEAQNAFILANTEKVKSDTENNPVKRALMEAQQRLYGTQGEYYGAQTGKVKVDTELASFNTQLAKKLEGTTIEQANKTLQETKARIQNLYADNRIKKATYDKLLKEIILTEKDIQLKSIGVDVEGKYRDDLLQYGIGKGGMLNDWSRGMTTNLNSVINSITDLFK